MDRSKQTLERIFLAARKAPLQPVMPASPEEIMAFSRRKVAGWLGARRRSPQPDPLWLWERVGGWSLGAALATLFLVLSLHHGSVESASLDPFEPEQPDETLFFPQGP